MDKNTPAGHRYFQSVSFFFLSILSSSRTRPCLCPAVAESALVARHRVGRASVRPCAVAAAPPRAPVRPPPRIRPPSAGCRAPPACRRASARPSLVAAALHCAGLRATHLQGQRAPSPPALRCLGRTRPTARRATSGLARPAPRRCSAGHARLASHHSCAATRLSPAALTRRFAGLMSRWTTRCAWRCTRPDSACVSLSKITLLVLRQKSARRLKLLVN